VLYAKETAVQANSWMTKISVKEDVRMRHGSIQAILYCGWFLLRPAVTGDSPDNLRFGGADPISQWTHQTSFDSAQECENYKRGTLKTNSRKTKVEELMHAAFLIARCIPADSVSLK
jgi:hypothetical protein